MTGEAQAGAAQPWRLGGMVPAPQQRDGETTATQRQLDGEAMATQRQLDGEATATQRQHDGEATATQRQRRRSGDGVAAQRGVVLQPRDGGATGPQQRRGVR